MQENPRLAPFKIVEGVAAGAPHVGLHEVLLNAVDQRRQNRIVDQRRARGLVVGKALCQRRSVGRGDQFVEVQVALPKVISEETKELLRQYAKMNSENPRVVMGLD